MSNGRKEKYNNRFDLETEKSILGAILLENSLCYSAIDLLKDGIDLFPPHRKIFYKMTLLAERSEVIDLHTLRNELGDDFDKVGGASYIASLIDGVPRTDTIEPYVKIVKEKTKLRRLISAANLISDMVEEGELDANAIIEKTEDMIFELSEEKNKTKSQHVAVAAAKIADHLQEKSLNPSKLIGLATHYADIDERTLGLPVGLSLIAARPSMGKTALSLNIACNVALAGGIVYYASIESATEKLVMRILASESRIDSYRLRQGLMDKPEWERLIDTMHSLIGTKFEIDDDPDITPAGLMSRIRQYSMINGGIDLVVVDYIQQMLPDAGHGDRREEIRNISKGLVKISRKFSVPVLALAQLSREVDKRPGHRPMKSDLAECSILEKDADLVMAIHREEEYERSDDNRGKAKIIFMKNRDGATDNDIDMVFISSYTRFESAWKDK